MREHFKSTVPSLSVVLGKRHCVLHLWKLLVSHGFHAPAKSISIRCLIDLIKKECPHGARHGKSEEQALFFMAYNAWKRCRKKKDGTGQNYI